jgi:hypothetical protein
MKNSNRGLLNEQRDLIDSWDNVEGDFDFDSAFDSADAWGNDGGYEEAAGTAGQNNQYTNRNVKEPVSMPYIYTVTSVTTNNVFVNMFGAEINLYNYGAGAAGSFGNPTGISFFYSLSGYFGGGITGYAALLQRTISNPFSIGRLRMECATSQTQLSQPITIQAAQPSGRNVEYPAIQFAKLNQFITFAVETEVDITLYGGVELTYNHLAGSVTAPNIITWYFWAADVASLVGAMEGRGAFKTLKRPETYLQQTIRMEAPRKQLGN